MPFVGEGDFFEGVVQSKADNFIVRIVRHRDVVPIQIGDLKITGHAPVFASITEVNLKFTASEVVGFAVVLGKLLIAPLDQNGVIDAQVVGGENLLLAQVLTLVVVALLTCWNPANELWIWPGSQHWFRKKNSQ